MQSKTILYFEKQGFKLTSKEQNSLQFERGSTLKNMVTFNPLEWKSITKIYFKDSKVISVFDINTTYQTVTIKEEKLWELFISNYQQTIETGNLLISENEEYLKETGHWEQ